MRLGFHGQEVFGDFWHVTNCVFNNIYLAACTIVTLLLAKLYRTPHILIYRGGSTGAALSCGSGPLFGGPPPTLKRGGETMFLYVLVL